ncbi:MAG: amino acid ABC transporter permease [Oscillospiraceae bacterium]|jgi:polar amino acid transport system permease protein|nr:amino acid ABC transporter permease [Oscillospiraceae bacterium]
MRESLEQIIGWLPELLKASGITLELTATSVCAALVLSVFLALGKIARVHRDTGRPVIDFFGRALTGTIRAVSSAYVFFFRGTPLLMQLFFIYYTLPSLVPAFTIRSRFFAAFLAFTLNVAAYLAEIIRAAIQSIPKGQLEASHALGLSYGQTMRMIVIPQAYRRMIPPVCNEFVMVLKDTSLVSIIALTDLTFKTKMIASNKASAMVYIPAMIIYLIMTAFFTVVFNRLEKRLAKKD